MAAVKSKDTVPEMIVRRLIHALGYRYRLHVRNLPGTPDLVFSSRRKVVLVSGCFWHGHTCGRCRLPASHREYWIGKIERNKRRDRKSRRALRHLGWQVLTVWECQLRDLADLKRRVRIFLH
jgi:DNA mismatch endonuclease (patch repair protein)